MKTREQVEALKNNWRFDPCWDIYDTEGFGEYRDELLLFQTNLQQEWRATQYNRTYDFARSIGIENLGDKEDEPNLELAKYLLKLESRIRELEETIARNFHILTR